MSPHIVGSPPKFPVVYLAPEVALMYILMQKDMDIFMNMFAPLTVIVYFSHIL